MDSVLNILLLAAIGLLLFLVIGFVGLKIPAPLRRPPGEPTGPVNLVSAPDSLPPAARRWLFHNSAAVPAPSTLAAWGRGRIVSILPIFGRVWLPLSWTIYLVPGTGLIVQNRVTWFNRNFIRSGEEFRDGKGAFLLGKAPNEYLYLDETERALAWFYSIWLAPTSLLAMHGVDFCLDENGVLAVTVDSGDQPALNFKLDLDPQTGCLRTITGTRKGSKTGGDYPYQAVLGELRSFEGAGQIPSRYTANWDNDIYLKLELAGIQLNQDITTPMQVGLAELPQD